MQAAAAGARLDGHARAVESLREEHVLAAQAVEGGRKLELGEREGVAQVQDTVHVGCGQGSVFE